jgi:type IV pilus assembly protein PilX
MKTYRNKEQGFVLITALLLLIVMTLLGVSAISSVTLQERMASNMREKAQAFESAAFAVREGEKELSAVLDYPNPGSLSTDVVVDIISAGAGVVQNPQYDLAEVTDMFIAGGALTPATQQGTRTQAKAYFYGVTAEGWGGNAAAYSNQMSVYARIY